MMPMEIQKELLKYSFTAKLPFLPSMTAKCNAVLPGKKKKKELLTYEILHVFLLCIETKGSCASLI